MDVGACVCEEGDYGDTRQKECRAVPEGVNGTFGGMTVPTLELEPGWWRTNASSTEVLPCLSEEHCLGGANVSEVCAEGMEGALCAVCKEDYATTGTGASLKCIECSGDATVTIVAGASIPLLLFLIFLYRLCKARGSVSTMKEHFAKHKEMSKAHLEKAGEKSETVDRITAFLERWQPPAKIILSYCQIMSGLAFVYDIRMPKKFTDLANYLSAAVNVDFISFMPIGCMAPTNFHSSLVGYTAGFLLVFAVMLAAFALNKKSKPE
jgi:hypothetical protein